MKKVLLLCLLLPLAGCKTYSRSGSGDYIRSSSDGPLVKPVVAVTDFENKSGFSGQWKLGEGMAELLMAELLNDRSVVVLERKNLDDVVGEIARQGRELFREEGRVQRGRLMNAQYVIRGVVTDFTVTGDSSGWFSLSNFGARGRGSKARVAINVRISDVTTGEILAAVEGEGEASAGGLGAEVNYKGVAFGGDSFFRTPLGEATEEAIHDAVRDVLRALPEQPWQARVAEADGETVLVNGGKNVKLRSGQRFVVREPARDVTDPVTGHVIARVPGRITGRIRVETVDELASQAILQEGSARRGDVLELEE